MSKNSFFYVALFLVGAAGVRLAAEPETEDEVRQLFEVGGGEGK